MRTTLRSLLALALAFTAALVIAACGSDDNGGGDSGDSAQSGESAEVKTGGKATINYSSYPDYLDPAMAYTVEAWQALWNVHLPLITYSREEGDAGAQLIPGLAEAMPEVTNEGKTYTFTLRDGLTYSDGKPVQAEDVEHTIKRVISLESGGSFFYTSNIEGAEDYQKAGKARGDISGIETNNETRQVVFNLTKANGQFPYILAMDFGGVVPSDTPFEIQTEEAIPATGPFTIENIRQNRSFTLKKNPSYKEIEGIQPANLDEIDVRVVKNGERQIQDTLRNQVDYVQDPAAGDALRTFRQQAKDRYKDAPAAISTYYMFLNQKVKPFDDPKVRQAVYFATDERDLSRIYGGLVQPDCNFLPPGMQGYEKIEPCPYGDPNGEPDLERAKQLIQEAGAEGEKVKVYGNDEEDSRQVAEYFTEVMNQIGLDAETRIVEGSVYFRTIGNQKEEAQAGYASWFQDYPHPANFLFLVDERSIQPTDNLNYGNVDDPEINRLIAEAEPKDLSEAAAQYAEADRKIIEGAHVIPFGHKNVPVVVSNRLNFDAIEYHPVYQVDYASFALR
jgi:peptide/nickel transport system substrate-binding protein